MVTVGPNCLCSIQHIVYNLYTIFTLILNIFTMYQTIDKTWNVFHIYYVLQNKII